MIWSAYNVYIISTSCLLHIKRYIIMKSYNYLNVCSYYVPIKIFELGIVGPTCNPSILKAGRIAVS